ncbi:MAG: hypothetical protein ABI120_08575 [Gemmatimonadaceae bacterium]
MSNTTFTVLVWLSMAAHVAVGSIAWRRGATIPLVPLINLAFALGLAGYWAQRLILALINGRIWYASDQVWLVYGVAICIVSILALTGRITWNGLHWTVFGAHALVCVAAVLFVSFFRMNRLV